MGERKEQKFCEIVSEGCAFESSNDVFFVMSLSAAVLMINMITLIHEREENYFE